MYKEKVASVHFYSNNVMATGLREYLSEPFPTVDAVLREYHSRHADAVRLTLLDGSEYWYRVEKSQYCTNQDDCQDDNCRCLDFIPTAPLSTVA